MSMRQLKRSIAHANMKDAGLAGVNVKHPGDGKSFFARNRRNFVYRPGDKKARRKALKDFDFGPELREV